MKNRPVNKKDSSNSKPAGLSEVYLKKMDKIKITIWVFPETYADIFIGMKRIGVVVDVFCQRLVKMAKFRNRLVHHKNPL